jgi:SRSO17 transposase
VRKLRQKDDLEWQTLRLRTAERGYLQAKFAHLRVWVVYGKEVRQEWLLFRQDAAQITYVLSNAPETIDLKTMAWRKTHRYLIERSNQDAKDEFGGDEFQTRKYRAWQHQLALTILTSWFVAETRLDWQKRFPQSLDLLAQYDVDALQVVDEK